ncbi:MAG: S41 family peptidase [Muribaculaceae bacterium]|nr:S41 family peptidase [Muribaculaceae bacterium]MBR3100549.1 S41 family peptidase [Muribaculaceae bacterium]
MKPRRHIYTLLVVLATLAMAGCHHEEEWNNDAVGNFEALWQIMDQHYSFFAYKNVDWNEVHSRYRARVGNNMTNQELFELCGEMLKELRDGHTNLIASHDVSRYWIWEQYPVNYDERTIDEHYLNFDYKRVSGIKYQILTDNIGYMYYGNFAIGMGDGNLDLILSHLATADGLIIDVRNNGGGYLTNVEKLVSRFIDQRIHAGAITHKNGPGHNDFAQPFDYYFEPTKNHIHYLKPVVVLTNRSSFSATNNFVAIMKSLPNVTIVGDTTGGGCGLPFTSELPNGWRIRFSSCPITSPDGQLTEFGVEPDVKVDMTDEDLARGHDTILDRAIELLISTKT